MIIYCNACCKELNPTERWITDGGEFHGLCSKCALIQADDDHKRSMDFIRRVNEDTARMEALIND